MITKLLEPGLKTLMILVYSCDKMYDPGPMLSGQQCLQPIV